jgi:hypothetical protein
VVGEAPPSKVAPASRRHSGGRDARLGARERLSTILTIDHEDFETYRPARSSPCFPPAETSGLTLRLELLTLKIFSTQHESWRFFPAFASAKFMVGDGSARAAGFVLPG